MTTQPEESSRALTYAEIAAALDAAESTAAAGVEAAIKQFLSAAKDVGTLGEMYGWWVKGVDSEITEALQRIWADAADVYGVEATPLDGMAEYMGKVRDRLVRGIDPPLPEQAFAQVRLSVLTGAAQGWSTDRVAEDIAARLSWAPNLTYWRAAKSAADARMDELLDPLGPPGTPGREWARLHDPSIEALREVGNFATERVEDRASIWQIRATTIARTESTGAFNAAALAALHNEGWAYKEWLATPDERTRESHRRASGQKVALASPFRVGASLLMMPGDPTGAPGEVINCRCVVLGSDSAEPGPPLALVAAGNYNPDQARVPKGNGRLSGRWIPTPDAIFDALNKAFDTPEKISKLPTAALDVHDQAQGILNAYADGDVAYTNTKAIKEIADLLRQVDHPAFKKAAQDMDDWASVDWYSDPDNPPPVPKGENDTLAAGLPSGWTAQPPATEFDPAVYVGPHGHTVRFAKGDDFTDGERFEFVTKVDGLLKEGAKASKLVDKRPVQVYVQQHDQFLAGVSDLGLYQAEGVAAYVSPDDDPDTINVHPFTVTQTAATYGKPLPARSEDHLPFAQSTITHELGHVVGERNDAFRVDVLADQSDLFDEAVRTGALGDYAKSGIPEAFAEAWLEWVADHSTGTKHKGASELAAKYAKQYGWGWTE